MKRLILVAMLVAGCGGTAQELTDAVMPSQVLQAVPQRTVNGSEVNSLSGRDCSVDPCPAVSNLQCVAVAGKRECFFVVAPTDGCLAIRVDRTSAGEVTPIICTAVCGGSDLPGAQTCPNGLSCSNDAARVCFH